MDETRPPSTPSTPASSLQRTPPSPETDVAPRSPLTDDLVASFDLAAVHRSHGKPVSCMDFSSNGAILAASSPDGVVAVYDALEGTQKGLIPVRKYGAGVLRFVHGAMSPAVVAASTARDDKLRLLDLNSQGYLRYFGGHEATVSSVAASPIGPSFISASKDAWIRVWDVRQETATGKVKASGCPVVAYDPKGLIFSIAYNAPGRKTFVKLYDARQYEDGPFLEFQLDNPSDSVPTCLKFSSDGEYFLLVNEDVKTTVDVFDAYKGKSYRRFSGHRNVSGIPLEASFSPDSAFVATGSDDGSLFAWNLETERLVLEKKQVHAMPTACTIWNPYYQMMATSCQNVVFWLASIQDSSPDY